jgi:hypothetical protein
VYLNGEPLEAHLSAYYGSKTNPPEVVPYPDGLKIVAGDAASTAPQSTKIVWWACGKGTHVPHGPTPPDCTGTGGNVRFHVVFPSCWNGEDLDSPDHRSHMAYPVGKECPASHPVPVPRLGMQIGFKKVIDGTAGEITLSSGNGNVYSLHADFFNAWDSDDLEDLVQGCINVGKRCGSVQD